MSSASPKRPGIPFEKKKLYTTTAAIIALVGAVLAAIIKFHDVLSLFKPKQVQENTEIVLDRSEAMNQQFEGGTKMQAALAAVENVLREQVADRDNLAFRQFGGPCSGDNTQLAIKFDQNNVDQLRKLLQNVRAEGQASLAHAVIDASADFNDPERFKGVSKRIIVITGGDDACVPNPIDAIRERLERNKRAGFEIQLDYHFIGLGLTAPQQQNLAQIAQSTGGKFVFVDHREDLDKALHQLLVVEPVVNDVNSLVQILNAGVARINETIGNINAKNYSAAEAGVQAARSEFSRSDLPFRDLGKRQSNDQFRKLYQLAVANRDLQDQFLSLSTALVSRGQANDIEGFNKTIQGYNQLSATYNQRVGQINEILRQLSSLAR